jgi:hypothetical protein
MRVTPALELPMSITSMMLTTLTELRPHHPGGGGGDVSSGGGLLGAMFGMIFGLFGLVIGLIIVASFWKIFTKAGEAGWMALIPILNIIILLKIIKKPIWWIVLFFIPLVNAIAGILVAIELAKSFGQGIGFAAGMILLPFIFYPMLAFGSSTYNPAYA